MTSQLNVDTIVDKAGSGGTNVKIANNSVTVAEGGSATTTTVQGLAKAWAEIDMTGTATNNDSFNIASFTDAGTGAFNLVIANDMANGTYCFSSGFNNQASDTSAFIKITGVGNKTAGQINMQKRENGNVVDCDVNCVIIHGDLA